MTKCTSCGNPMSSWTVLGTGSEVFSDLLCIECLWWWQPRLARLHRPSLRDTQPLPAWLQSALEWIK